MCTVCSARRHASVAELRFALIGEGSTDHALLPVIEWLLREHLSPADVVGIWANRRQLPAPRPRSLAERIVGAMSDFSCDLLFVHRDADRAGRSARVDEIVRAVSQARTVLVGSPPVIPIVPVRETEAWLLLDEVAIRSGARNPNGRVRLALPRASQIERLSDPKHTLRDLLHVASELRGRDRDRLLVDPIDVANSISDFAPLRQLPAFQAFEDDVRRVIAEQGWPERLG